MMNSIVIYGSHYGTTQQYAEELAKRINLKCLNFKEVTEINDYDEIIYLGGLYAGGILGMEKTFKKISNPNNKKIIIITVGLADPKDDENIKSIKSNISKQLSPEIFEKAKIFNLRGGIDYSKLNFLHKSMMKLLYTKIKKIPENERTADVKGLIETYNKSVSFVDLNTLTDIIDYLKH